MATEPWQKICMYIGPFGQTLEEETQRKNLEYVCRQFCQEQGFAWNPFHNTDGFDMRNEIFNKLWDAHLIIADLRLLNPNVFYELGICHCLNKPVIHLKPADMEKIPWDIDKNFIIEYHNPLQIVHAEELKAKIGAQYAKIKDAQLMRPDQPFNTLVNALGVRNINASLERFKELKEENADKADIINELKNYFDGKIGEITSLLRQDEEHPEEVDLSERERQVLKYLKRGMTQVEIADILGIHQPSVSKIKAKLIAFNLLE